MPNNASPSTSFVSSRSFISLVAAAELAATFIAAFVARANVDPRISAAVTICISLGGTLMTLTGIAIQLRLDAIVRNESNTLIARIDDETRHLRHALSLFNTYHQVSHEDLLKYRDDALKSALNTLNDLTRGQAEVEGSEYYSWLNRKMKSRPRTVRAVSFRPLSVYADDPREANWALANTQAAEAGTKISRIFILDHSVLVPTKARSLLTHLVLNSRTSAFVVWRSRVHQGLLKQLFGGGFSIYDDDVVFYDRSYFQLEIGVNDPAGLQPQSPIIPRATMYCKPHPEYQKYETMFEELEDLVPHAAKTGPKASCANILSAIDGYLTTAHGSLEDLVETPETALLKKDWIALKAEITGLNAANA
ncbi:MAG: hypothetical protein FD180_228 [Planctomycetota bacterium]|nr:MAG: hypothetical protein FD180_228 [Planctomycetota bacterium]